MSSDIDRYLLRGRVLVELGWLPEAEVEVAAALEQDPDSIDALGLFAKIKHIKGELSQAIACWAQIHARSRHRGVTTAPLGAFSHDAGRAPPSPSLACVEIERALALFHQGRASDARAWCAALAARHRGTDLRLYKLAGLAGASLAELCGDLASARATLEELGRERGLEHDLDRLCALVRIYDRIGTTEALDAATKICRHVLGQLERGGVERLSMLGQLASLERRVGRGEAAAELDARFLAAMRRRMHRASLHDLVRVAAGEYIPIERLRSVRPADDRLPVQLPPRERALVHTLRGEAAAARALFEQGANVIDSRYCAELFAIGGDEERAIALFLDTLQDGAEDPHVVGWLLERHARAPSRAILHHWADPDRRERTLRLLEAGCRLAPQRAESWRRLATLHSLGGQRDEAHRCTSRAAALAAACEQRIGRVLAAGVYHFADKPKGLLHEIWVRRAPTMPGRGGVLAADDIHGNVTPELRAAIRNTFVAVREYARAKLPDATADLDDYTYSYKLPKEDEPSGGLSAGLPSALAFLSVFLQRPVANAIASSGTLISEAHDVITIGRIGDVEYKVRAAYHGNLCSLILPVANRAELERTTLVPRAITSELVHYVADLDQAMSLAFGADVFTRP